ncbi:MAG: IS3 family transposase [Caldilineales bacterium]
MAHAAATGEVSKQAACGWFGISRQAYYQARYRRMQRAAEDHLLLELVQGIRQRHPRMGGRKLFHELQEAMAALDIARGRDAFFDLLRQHDLLVPSKRSRRRTTRSGLWRCPNRLIDLDIVRTHQVWVADITYLTTEQGFVYLALLTDAFSRFIVGYDLSSSLVAEGALRALDQAIASTPDHVLNGLIHHSDHGVQYTAWPYWDRLQSLGILSSMGAVGNCYDNALAERVIGILKNEYALDDLFVDARHALTAVKEAIWLYNYERPHLSLRYRKPAQVHLDPQVWAQISPQQRLW